MEQQILIPLDGSALAEAILPYAVAVARATGSALTLLSVIPQTLVDDPIYATFDLPDPEQEESRASRSDYLASVATRLKEEGLQVRTKVLAGNPATHIVSLAQQDASIRLIAMASHGRSGIGRVFFGSVAAKVIEEVPMPLLLFRPPQHATPVAGPVSYQTILVPLDGSICAEQALDHARAFATAVGARLILLSVVYVSEHLTASGAGGIPPWVTAQLQTETQSRTDYLEHLAQPLCAQGLAVQTEVVSGQPIEGTLQSSARHHPDLIVLTTRGRNGLQQVLIGNVAMKVLQHAGLPALLVPTHTRKAAVPPNQEGLLDRRRA